MQRLNYANSSEVSAGSPCATSLFVPIKARAGVTAPPPLSSGAFGVELLSRAEAKEGMWAPCQPESEPEPGRKTAGPARVGFSSLRQAGYHGNQPPPLPPPDGGAGGEVEGTSSKCQLFQETRRKEAHFHSIVHEGLFFKTLQKSLERNSRTTRSLKTFLITNL